MGNPREIHYVPLPGTSSSQGETSLNCKRKEITPKEDSCSLDNYCTSEEAENKHSVKKMRLLESCPTSAQTQKIMEHVWGPHNTTMTWKEREQYLSQPPVWPLSLRHIITYEKRPKTPDFQSPEEEKQQ